MTGLAIPLPFSRIKRCYYAQRHAINSSFLTAPTLEKLFRMKQQEDENLNSSHPALMINSVNSVVLLSSFLSVCSDSSGVVRMAFLPLSCTVSCIIQKVLISWRGRRMDRDPCILTNPLVTTAKSGYVLLDYNQRLRHQGIESS